MAPSPKAPMERRGLERADIIDYPAVVEKLAERQKLPETKVRAVVRDLLAIAAEGLKDGKAVRIGGLGLLRIRDAQAGAAAVGAGSTATAKKRVVLKSAKKFNIAVDLEE